MIATEADLNDIQIFVRVVESGSFTAAARALYLPKSSVSRKVSRLEERLGVRLLHRTTRSLTLTSAGRVYYDRTSRMMAELAEAEATVSGLAETPKGPLKVTVPISFLETGRDLFVQFLESFPEVRLALEVTDRMVSLVDEGFDLAIRGGRPPDPSLTGHKLMDSSFRLLASRDYLDRAGCPKSPSDLKSHECLILGMKSPDTWTFETPRGPVEVLVQGRLASTNVQALLRAARLGMGVARLPVAGAGFDLSGVEEILPEYTSPGGDLWVVYPSSRHLSPAVRAFAEFLENHIGKL
ncbi:MAG: LysR family transcriptional regulator [Candidatus Eremiobacteraeota bacterium]|nr:LysR family transcriptional regulator [Candidatus Eremiobacteraeota bacterium]